MSCGHTAQAVTADNQPACAICGCLDVEQSAPDLTGRVAHCTYGNHKPKASSFALAFFKHQPEREHDSYYCGCFGWD